jgi:hypothetical protein
MCLFFLWVVGNDWAFVVYHHDVCESDVLFTNVQDSAILQLDVFRKHICASPLGLLWTDERFVPNWLLTAST